MADLASAARLEELRPTIRRHMSPRELAAVLEAMADLLLDLAAQPAPRLPQPKRPIADAYKPVTAETLGG